MLDLAEQLVVLVSLFLQHVLELVLVDFELLDLVLKHLEVGFELSLEQFVLLDLILDLPDILHSLFSHDHLALNFLAVESFGLLSSQTFI